MAVDDFAAFIAYLEAGSGKPLAVSREEIAARLKVYHDTLGHHPPAVLKAIAQKVLSERKWASFPSIGELTQAAAEILQGQAAPLTPAEAWEKAWKAVANIDPEIDGSVQKECAKLPPLVVEAMKAFGIVALIYAEPNFARPQFIKIYESLQARHDRLAALPPTLRKVIGQIGVEKDHEAKITFDPPR